MFYYNEYQHHELLQDKISYVIMNLILYYEVENEQIYVERVT